MKFFTYNEDGAIYQPAPINAFEITQYANDSRRVLRDHRLHKRFLLRAAISRFIDALLPISSASVLIILSLSAAKAYA